SDPRILQVCSNHWQDIVKLYTENPNLDPAFPQQLAEVYQLLTQFMQNQNMTAGQGYQLPLDEKKFLPPDVLHYLAEKAINNPEELVKECVSNPTNLQSCMERGDEVLEYIRSLTNDTGPYLRASHFFHVVIPRVTFDIAKKVVNIPYFEEDLAHRQAAVERENQRQEDLTGKRGTEVYNPALKDVLMTSVPKGKALNDIIRSKLLKQKELTD